ncbi:protein of unknown function [Candidatus Methylomirabilis oxygeniifera]|uniref:Uncharacterized protein n=1 Tax=Methylomirabilis oxygeniifera TaxID=671143 RepID=D5MEZ3_METO1|nr:protein of unknown function [Candidatus Methylomirabilis oxyfera]
MWGEVFVLAHWTAGRIAEPGSVFEAITAIITGRRMNKQAEWTGYSASDMLEVIDDHLFGHHEVPGQLIQRPLAVAKHRHDLLPPR